jgi:polar amino acid transport system substrate-binding protein
MSRHQFCRWTFQIILTFVCPVLPASAQKTDAPTCPSRPIVMALFEFGNFYHAGSGLDKDIADALATRSGCRFELRVMQRQHIWQALQDGTVDMTLTAAAMPERTMFSWAAPYLWMKYVVIIRKDIATPVHSKAEFLAAPDLKLGVGHSFVHGHSYDEFVTQLRNIGRVVEVDDTDRLYKMFRAGRFQALISTQLVYSSYLKDDIQTDTVRVEDWSPGKPKDDISLLICKKNFSQDEAKQWGDLMKSISSDGTLLRLLSKYIDQSEAAKMLAP